MGSVDETAEQKRVAMGISRNQFEQMLSHFGSGTNAATALRVVSGMYDAFLDEVRSRLSQEFERPAYRRNDVAYLSTVQAARALGVGDFHLSNLRDRKKLDAMHLGRRAMYSREALDRLLEPQKADDPTRHPLAMAFVRYFERETGRSLEVTREAKTA